MCVKRTFFRPFTATIPLSVALNAPLVCVYVQYILITVLPHQSTSSPLVLFLRNQTHPDVKQVQVSQQMNERQRCDTFNNPGNSRATPDRGGCGDGAVVVGEDVAHTSSAARPHHHLFEMALKIWATKTQC